uniref:Serum amyloid A protein n=1 Tax=Mus spicilegus TaxID=10103 RepID=A0A8C6GGA8_MUSSI
MCKSPTGLRLLFKAVWREWKAQSEEKRKAEKGWLAGCTYDAREAFQEFFGRGHEDTMADQEANRHGRSGKDPNYYRPPGLPDKY